MQKTVGETTDCELEDKGYQDIEFELKTTEMVAGIKVYSSVSQNTENSLRIQDYEILVPGSEKSPFWSGTFPPWGNCGAACNGCHLGIDETCHTEHQLKAW